MSTRTARRRLRIATALIAATLAAPGVASAATDLRGEYAKDPGTGSQVDPAVATVAADLRGENARGPGIVSQVDPAVATVAADLRGENARGPGIVSQVDPAVATAAADLRGEFAQVPEQLAATAPAADARGEFAKPDYRNGPRVAAPAHSGEPSAAPSTLPFIVAGLVVLLGFAAIAGAMPLRRRTRLSH